jgi:gas vesicle protein
MDRIADVKETIETLGEDLRARVSRNSEPIKQEVKHTLDEAMTWIKKNPVLSLGMAVLAGAAVGAAVTRLVTPTQSDAEKKVRHWVHNAQGSWDEIRQALTSVKSAISRLSA